MTVVVTVTVMLGMLGISQQDTFAALSCRSDGTMRHGSNNKRNNDRDAEGHHGSPGQCFAGSRNESVRAIARLSRGQRRNPHRFPMQILKGAEKLPADRQYIA